MTQEQQAKLEQALATKLTDYIKLRHDQSRCVGYSDGVLAGAQTILYNPGEWGLVGSKECDEIRRNYVTLQEHHGNVLDTIEEMVSRRVNQWISNNEVLKDVSLLQAENTRLREALERIVDMWDDQFPAGRMVIIAQEALKQHNDETDNTGN